jgi:hypothetical protein
MRMLLALALGFVLGGSYAITAHADPVPDYDYVCKSRDQGPITCLLSEIFHPTQAPWDPKPGQTLFDQIPNTDGEALRICCGRNPTKCLPHQSDRC